MFRTLLLALLLCLPGLGQQAPAPPPDSNPPQAETQQQQTKGVRKVLRRATPNCVNIAGHEDCWSRSEQEKQSDAQNQQPQVPRSQPTPRSDAGESSSRDTKVDLAPPGEVSAAPADVQELRPYDPHKAEKDIEIGDFYFKRKNYAAAESRYAGALLWKPNDAVATFRLAEAQEKLGKIADARKNYQGYLKILPQGEFADKAQKALARLDLQTQSRETPISPPSRTRQ